MHASSSTRALDIILIGAGALGCLLAAQLAFHANITLYCRQEYIARLVRNRGIGLQGMDGTHRLVRVQTMAALDTGPRHSFDYAIICTKAQASGDAGAIAQALLRPEGLALTLQNGLGNRERIAEHVGAERTMVGITAQAATLLEPGGVRHAGAGRTRLAPEGNRQRRHSFALVRLFNAAGIETEMADDPEALLWSKLIVNVGINALAALLRVPNGVLAAEPLCRDIMAQAVAEAVQVAEALAISLPERDPMAHVFDICAQTATNQASTLQDILRRNPTEVEAINGAVTRLGALHQIPTPVNGMLTQLVRALEATAPERVA